MRISDRVLSVQRPIIPEVAELIRQHPGTISLGQGVVAYPPPPQALAEIHQFLSDPENNKYKPVHGIPSLLQAIETKLRTENRIEVGTDNQVVVTAGGNLAFVNAVQAIADPGDEFIFPVPYSFNHEMAVTLANCKTIPVPTDQNYLPRIVDLERAITPRTRAIVTVSPGNPTGAVIPESTLRSINQLCRQRGLYHLHDEAYEYFIWGNTPHFSPASIEGAASHTISLFSLSKAYGFASWRIGYMLIPRDLFESVRKIQDTLLVCPPVISQFAATGALAAGKDYCLQQLSAMRDVRQIVQGELAQIDSLCTTPSAEGAFYFLPRLHTQMPSMELVERLIREHGVAVIPGTTFGIHDSCTVRIAYGALTRETAAQGIRRFVKGVRALVQ